MKSDIEKLSKGKKILGLLIGFTAITMMVVDYFVKNIEFNSVMLVIILSIGIIIFNGSEKDGKKELDPKKQKVIQSILTFVLALGVIIAIIVA